MVLKLWDFAQGISKNRKHREDRNRPRETRGKQGAKGPQRDPKGTPKGVGKDGAWPWAPTMPWEGAPTWWTWVTTVQGGPRGGIPMEGRCHGVGKGGKGPPMGPPTRYLLGVKCGQEWVSVDKEIGWRELASLGAPR